jgi:group I intron endonuclease
MTIIYALTCPTTGQVRYVGKTDMSIAKRLASHIFGCKAQREKRVRKNVWLAEIIDADMVPGIHVLERVPDGSCWQDAEIRWIAHYRVEVGSDLLNVSNGGKGQRGYVPTEETRAKISAAGKARAPYPRKPHSEETRAKIAATLKGRPGPMAGKKHSPETLAKMSAAQAGRKLTEEHCATLSKALKGRSVSPETRAKIGAKVSASAARKRADKAAQT